MSFKIIKKSKKSLARIGVISTSHGKIHTPAFIPVATQATVKGLTVDQLKGIANDALLCNAYHLYLRPGDLLVKKSGGLHKFMNWNKPIFTDSGGFQVFSLGLALKHGVGKIANIFPKENNDSKEPVGRRIVPGKSLMKITEEGVKFKSHIDGSSHFLTPEKSIAIQQNLGADIIFTFDECTSPLSSYEYTKEAMERTHRWAVRSLKAFKNSKKQQLFGIVQGGEYKNLREQSTLFISSLNFAGFGIGGSLGKSKKDMHKVLDWTVSFLPENKPRHLLGIGEISDIYEAVKRGVDTFDCVIPTRLGRNGSVLAKKGNLNIKSSRYFKDKKPLEKNCSCYTCQSFTRSYISHLFRAGEMLGGILTTIHNLYFMESYMKEIRQKIKDNKI